MIRAGSPAGISGWLGCPEGAWPKPESQGGQFLVAEQHAPPCKEIQMWNLLGFHSRELSICQLSLHKLEDQVNPQKWFAHHFSKMHFLTIPFLFYFFPSLKPELHSTAIFLARTITVIAPGLPITHSCAFQTVLSTTVRILFSNTILIKKPEQLSLTLKRHS